MDKLININPIILALLATKFTYLMNLLGSCTVLIFSKISIKILDCFLSFGAGIMIASSFFSLLNPTIDLSLNKIKLVG